MKYHIDKEQEKKENIAEKLEDIIGTIRNADKLQQAMIYGFMKGFEAKSELEATSKEAS